MEVIVEFDDDVIDTEPIHRSSGWSSLASRDLHEPQFRLPPAGALDAKVQPPTVQRTAIDTALGAELCKLLVAFAPIAE